MSDFHRSLDRAVAVMKHPHICPSCKGENTVGTTNEAGDWHGHCMACGLRFWGYCDSFPQADAYQSPS